MAIFSPKGDVRARSLPRLLQAPTQPGHYLPGAARLTCELAAKLPTSGLAALRALREAGRVRPDQQVLINGASGGAATFAVPLAKVVGAEVPGVCRSGNVSLVRSLGADPAIDHPQQDFTQGGQRHDLASDGAMVSARGAEDLHYACEQAIRTGADPTNCTGSHGNRCG